MRKLFSLGLTIGLAAFAETSPPAKTGPAVGQTVPAFSASDQNGLSQSLQSILGPKGAMLVFVRSADWCPYCKGQLVELQSNLAKLRAEGLGIAAISYDSVAILKNFADRKGIAFPLLSDPQSKIIRAFGILNDQSQPGSMQYGVPYPGTYLVDRAGRVTAKYFEDDDTRRYTSGEILVSRFGESAGAAQSEAAGKHLKLSAAASNDHVRPGERIALTLDVQVAPGLHVYAPGVNSDYIPIEWTIKESPAIQAQAAVYPKSQMLHMEVLNVTVPVFDGAFRLVRDVTIAPGAEGTLTIEGVLKSQACGATICYLPETLPVRWTLQVDAPDRERAPAEIQHKGK